MSELREKVAGRIYYFHTGATPSSFWNQTESYKEYCIRADSILALVEPAIRADEGEKERQRIIKVLDDYFGRDGMGKPHGRTTKPRQAAKALILSLILDSYLKQGVK